MQNIKRHVDELMALINSSIEAKDLMVKILSGLHEEYKDLAFAIQARENLISFSDLHKKLFNFQAHLRKEAAKHPPLPSSINPTTKLLQFNKKNGLSQSNKFGKQPNNSQSQAWPWEMNSSIGINLNTSPSWRPKKGYYQLYEQQDHIAKQCPSYKYMFWTYQLCSRSYNNTKSHVT